MSDPEKTAGKPSAGRRMTVRQVADEWQLYPGTIRRAIRSGDLPAVRAGSGYRVLADDVEEWIQVKWG